MCFGYVGECVVGVGMILLKMVECGVECGLIVVVDDFGE